MPTFEHDGFTFSYMDEKVPSGVQVPFIFQHGIGSTVHQPSSLMAPLPPGVRFIGLDSRGHGDTQPTAPSSNHRFSFATFANDVVSLMDHLALPRAVLGGISIGAGIALNLALRFPERVAGLVLARPASLAGLIAAADMYRRRAEAVKGHQLFDVRRLEFLPSDKPFDRFSELSEIRVPALVLATDHDAVHSLRYGQLLASCIPGAWFLEVTPKSESPELHQREIREGIASFLEELILPVVAEKDGRGLSRSLS